MSSAVIRPLANELAADLAEATALLVRVADTMDRLWYESDLLVGIQFGEASCNIHRALVALRESDHLGDDFRRASLSVPWPADMVVGSIPPIPAPLDPTYPPPRVPAPAPPLEPPVPAPELLPA
jgi:hypothetical protein